MWVPVCTTICISVTLIGRSGIDQICSNRGGSKKLTRGMSARITWDRSSHGPAGVTAAGAGSSCQPSQPVGGEAGASHIGKSQLGNALWWA